MSKSDSAMNAPEVMLSSFSWNQVPSVAYTLQNGMISLASVVASTASLLLTVLLIFPLSLYKAILFRGKQPLLAGASRNKVVLIVGASRGIGFNVVKQYMSEPETVIIAASRSIESLRSSITDLGPTPAKIHIAEVDLTACKKQIADSLKSLDEQYGPITHLYQVSGVSNHLDTDKAWGLDATSEMINVNVVGTVASVLTMYELMKSRGYGKICVVGSVAGIYSPANMISYAATKSFVNTFSSSLRVLAAPCGVEVVTVQPGFIDTRMTKMMRSQGSTTPASEFASAEKMAEHMKLAVEEGGVGVVSWPLRQSVIMYALKCVNPICEEFGKWTSMKLGMSGKKIT